MPEGTPRCEIGGTEVEVQGTPGGVTQVYYIRADEIWRLGIKIGPPWGPVSSATPGPDLRPQKGPPLGPMLRSAHSLQKSAKCGTFRVQGKIQHFLAVLEGGVPSNRRPDPRFEAKNAYFRPKSLFWAVFGHLGDLGSLGTLGARVPGGGLPGVAIWALGTGFGPPLGGTPKP